MTAESGPSLPGSAGVVVVGGGVMGASIAFHLAEAGVEDVLLLERGALGGGSTVKAAGGVRAQFSDPVNIALGMRGLDAFEDFPNRPGQEIDLHQPGYLFLLTDPEQVRVYEQSVALQNAMGVPSRMLTPEEAKALSPAMDVTGVLAASFHARDGYCSPESVVQGYASGARRHGATVLTGIEVTDIRVEDGVIRSVVTDRGEVRTAAVVCAAGAWSKSIGAMAGVGLPIEPLRRQILVTEPLSDEQAARFPIGMPMTIDAGSTFYLHREGPAILLGMSYRDEEPGFREDYSDAWLPDLTATIERCCPDLLDVGIAHQWVGFYEVTPDHNALVGESESVSRFLYAAGFSGHGFLQGPAIGEVIRDLYLHREPPIDVTPFTADRFAAGLLRGEVNIV